jgi:hypothetical protein
MRRSARAVIYFLLNLDEYARKRVVMLSEMEHVFAASYEATSRQIPRISSWCRGFHGLLGSCGGINSGHRSQSVPLSDPYLITHVHLRLRIRRLSCQLVKLIKYESLCYPRLPLWHCRRTTFRPARGEGLH